MNSTDTAITLGPWLKLQRQVRDWTQFDLSVQADCSVESIRGFESEKRKPPKQVAAMLAACLGVSADEAPQFILWARHVPGALPPASILAHLPAANKQHLPPHSSSSSLPDPLSSLLGREGEVKRILTMLRSDDIRLLTLTGPGGIGKTRLAVAIAHAVREQITNNVVFASLVAVRELEMVLPTIQQALDQADTVPGLLVIDNFEHVIAVADAVSQLLADMPGLKVLVTSREILRVQGEHEFVVQPLALPEPQSILNWEDLARNVAVSLFVQRSRALRPDFQLTEQNAYAVAEICRRLDGIPLALELAAARMKVIAPHTLLELLDARLSILTYGLRTGSARQQTLRDTIDWSYALLDPAERKLFARLAIFVGGFTLAAANVVCNTEHEPLPLVVDRLTALVDKSLLRQGPNVEGEPRFGMLETIREYALEWLRASGDEQAIHERHAEYYKNLIESLRSELSVLAEPPYYLDVEKANLRAILGWALQQDREDIADQVGITLWELGWASYLEGPTACGWDLV